MNRLVLPRRSHLRLSPVRLFRASVLAVLLLGCACSALAQGAPAAPTAGHVPASIVPQDRLVQPEVFAAELKSGAKGVMIVQVGSRVLYEQAHIPGAIYAGPGGSANGLDTLGARMEEVSPDKEIVLYCGCCPWSRCPNIGPAWRLLHDMGFTHLRVLYLAENFGTNWVAKGYPSEASQ